MLPTGSEDELTTDTWAAGQTGVALRQSGPGTVGLLFNYPVYVADAGRRTDINSTFIQPFGSYTTPSAVTYTLNSEATHDWENRDSAVPINFVVSKVVPVGGQLFSIGGGLRYWVDSTENGPEGFGARLIITALFPK